jgi:TRAP-type mannitol/chloroaromatic compound transport system permease large subunit
MTAWLGLALLPLVGLAVIFTGMPAFLALIGGAAAGAVVAIVVGNGAVLGALPNRLVALLESDLLQALPLFVLMGTLIDRLPLADILFRSGWRLAGRGPAAPRLAALGLGALLAPMNGSVGASVSVMVRAIRPRLMAAGVAPAQRIALMAAAATLGVVVPPSLVLIFLGDAMMGAHTIAVNLAGRPDQIINTRDIFRAALVPAGLTLALWAIVTWLLARGAQAASPPPLTRREAAGAAVTALAILTLLAGVALGLFYAVEAAALGCVALLGIGLASGHLDRKTLTGALQAALAISGALFALLVAATTFTLVLRVLGTDQVLTDAFRALPGGGTVALAAALAMIVMAAMVLDAFEIIFVVVPLIMPGVLVKAPDAAWVAAATILTLQASFLIPPVGFAIMMTRAGEGERVAARALVRPLAAYLAVPVLVVALVLAVPGLTHLFSEPPRATPALSGQELKDRLNVPLPEPDDVPLRIN